MTPNKDKPKRLALYSDGGCDPNPGTMAIAAVLYDGRKEINRVVAVLPEEGTNNIAEYQALIDGLLLAAVEEPDELVCYTDSKLMVRQLRGDWRIKKPHLDKLVDRALELMRQFENVEVKLTSRGHPRIMHCDRLLHKARAEAREKGKHRESI